MTRMLGLDIIGPLVAYQLLRSAGLAEVWSLVLAGTLPGFGVLVDYLRWRTLDVVGVVVLGGIGLSCVQGGVLAGAAKIVAVDVLAPKLELARRLGATHLVDASRDDPVAAIRELTGGGADYTFEAVGSVAVIRQALEALGAGGALTIVGVPKLGTAAEFVVHALYQNKAILGCRYGTARPRRDFPMLAALYLAGRLRIDELITARYALEDFGRALADLQRGDLARGVFSLG